jgi:signal transduction histidine kinase
VDLFYEGAGLARQTLPDSALFHKTAGAARWVPGLTYSFYANYPADRLDFQNAAPARTGVVANFHTIPQPHDSYFGCALDGFVRIPTAGEYRFSVVPRGRNQLFIGNATIADFGPALAPTITSVVPGQVLAEKMQSQWVSAEGTVTYISQRPTENCELELSSEAGKIRAVLDECPAALNDLYPGSRIRVTGVCRAGHRLDGPTVPGEMWVPSAGLIQLLEVAPELWSSHPLTAISNLAALSATGGVNLVHLAGRAGQVEKEGRVWILEDATGQAEISTAQAQPAPGDSVEALAVPGRAGSRWVLRDGYYREIDQVHASTNLLPLLTTAGQVKRLPHDEALRSYPVRLRGVITWCGGGGFVLQDTTMGIFAQAISEDDSGRQRVGDYVEIDGITTAQFSPMILARRIVRLGLGVLPEPVLPTWDQLMDGALDTEYVEVQGVVTSVEMTRMTVLTHDGKLQIHLPEKRFDDLKPYLNSIVRIRGSLWAVKDETTHVLIPGAVQIHDASISVDQPAPADPFSAPLKHVSDLLLFDVKASAFQMVKIAGQIVCRRGSQYYLMDAGSGLQFFARDNADLSVGDRVEVAGFPVVGGLSPILREAFVRKTGRAPLVPPRQLTERNLLNPDYDATLVAVTARLTSLSREQQDQVFSLQAGTRMFVAKLNGQPAQSLPVGSLLNLTGVYVGRDVDRTAGRAIDSFELLLNAPEDIRILALPPWWTLRRLLGAIGLLLGILAVALAWIRQLHRQVEQRTAQLKQEVLARERVEQQRAIESERARIARDLHDDLGSSLTEISMLADAGAGRPATFEKAGHRFEQIGAKARTIVNALDVIVWLVNPQKDSLPFLISYLASYVEEYMAPSGIDCRVKVPADVPALKLPSNFRHNLFLAVKEALNNVVRHSRAAEVRFEIAIEAAELKVNVADNGCGFDTAQVSGGNGLSNYDGRLAAIGGHCQICSRPGGGTAITFAIPLPPS